MITAAATRSRPATTAAATAMTDRPRGRKPGPGAVLLGSAALFFVVLALLAFQMRAGRDPSLGAGSAQVAEISPAPRRVLVRRVIVTRVVKHIVDETPAAAPA